MELIDEADIVAADRRAFVIRKPPAGAAREDHIARIRPFQQSGRVKQRRLAGPRRRDQRDHLAAVELEINPVQDGQLTLPLHVVTLDRLQFENYVGSHVYSYRSASTGSSRAARHAGRMVAMKDSTSAMRTTDAVSLKSMRAGSWLRK